MLRAIVFCPDPNTSRTTINELRTALSVDIVRGVDSLPPPAELERILNSHVPDVVFLHCRLHERALECARNIEALGCGVPVVGLDSPPDAHILMNFVRAGVREFLPVPPRGSDAIMAWQNVEKLAANQRPSYRAGGAMQCFLPAKPGVGASVIAVQTAVAIADMSDRRVLLLDLDLTAASASFLLRVPAENSVQGVLDYAYRLDQELWDRLKFTYGKLDVIGAGVPGATTALDPSAVLEVVRFASRQYDVVIADLSGALDAHATALLSWARHVYLVCTQEVPALHLGRIKSQALSEIGVRDRTSVVLNRVQAGGPLSLQDVESVLEARVRFTFPNDYKRVNAAAMDGSIIPTGSDLGKQFRAFAASIVGGTPPDTGTAQRKKRFFDLFGSGSQSVGTQRGEA